MIGKYKIIGMCVSRCGDAVISKMTERLNALLVQEDYRIFIYNTCSDLFWDRASEKGDASVFDLIDYDKIDILMIFDEKLYDKALIHRLIDRAGQADIPVLVLGGSYENCININFNYGNGMEQVIRHVIEEHHPKSMHFIAGSFGNEQSDERIRVFYEILQEYGYETDESQVSYGEFWSEPTVRCIRKLVTEGRVPDAIICANDIMAVHTCNVLKEYGYDVPKDVIVTGFDGIDDAKFANPQITTCECSYEHIVNEIAEIITEAVDGEQHTQYYDLQPKLVVGRSCGCNPKKNISISDRVIHLNNRIYRFHEDDYSFGTIAAKMMACHELSEAASMLKNKYVVFDTLIILKPECIDETKDPSVPHSDGSFEGKLCMFFDSDRPDTEPYLYDASSFLPNIHLLLVTPQPLIFTAIHNLEIPLGFSCFHFHTFDMDNYDRLTQVVNCLNSAIIGLRNIRYQRHLLSVIEELYQADTLTGLLNRRAFAERYRELSEQAVKEGLPVTFLFADLDGLKQINNTYGHSEGDYAIRATADALKSIAPEQSALARFGGDEMVGVYLGAYDETVLRQAFEDKMDEINRLSGKNYRIAASLGICEASQADEMDLERLTEQADRQMYEQKIIRKGDKDYRAGYDS